MKLSIAVPIHDMPNASFFLKRLASSLERQTFQDFEVVFTKEGKMAENTNAAIKRCKGEIIKVLYMDDYLAHENALQVIVDSFKGNWLVTGCEHDDGKTRGNQHLPTYRGDIHKGHNSIGSPSVMAFRNGLDMYFDEQMTWLLDCDFYKRMYDKFGEPVILNDINVVIGIGEHQMTNIMGDTIKNNEHDYMQKKYAK